MKLLFCIEIVAVQSRVAKSRKITFGRWHWTPSVGIILLRVRNISQCLAEIDTTILLKKIFLARTA